MPGSTTQTGTVSGGAGLYQAGRDIKVQGPPVVPRMESLLSVAGVGRVPAGSGVFVGRAGELARLEAAVAVRGRRVVVVAVHGLGGVGKSTLAARFAELHADRFSPVWWLTADSPAAIEAGLAELAGAVAPEAVVLPSEQWVELGLRWLATHDDWLLVLDNVTVPGDVAGVLGRVWTGTVVVTSRRGSGWRGVETVRLDVLPERFEATLADQERVLGPDHPETLTSRNNVAGAYASAGDLGRAIPLYEANLADRERVLGFDHPDTLVSLDSLAGAYASAGDLGQAIALFEVTLADSDRVLGPDHPDTLTSRNNLAHAFQEAGDLGQAIPLYRTALNDAERLLGLDHPTTRAIHRNLDNVHDH